VYATAFTVTGVFTISPADDNDTRYGGVVTVAINDDVVANSR
jgi:hypothetical protein